MVAELWKGWYGSRYGTVTYMPCGSGGTTIFLLSQKRLFGVKFFFSVGRETRV